MAIPITLDLSTRKSTPGVSEHVCTQASVCKNCAGRRPRRQMCRGASECAECWTGRVKGCGHGDATRDARRATQRVCGEARASFISLASHAGIEVISPPASGTRDGVLVCLQRSMGLRFRTQHPSHDRQSVISSTRKIWVILGSDAVQSLSEASEVGSFPICWTFRDGNGAGVWRNR